VEFGLQDSILFSAATPGSATMPGNPGGTIMNSVFPGFRDARNVGTQGGVTSLIPSNATGGFSFSASSESVSMFIRALETMEKTQILSRPRLVTLHNRRASVVVGENIPYAASTTSTGNNINTSSDFREVGTILDVVPRIMPDDMIAMAIYVERSSLIQMVEIGTGSAPYIKNTNATTTINAMDGQTVIFAGLITEQKKSVNNSIPGLNKIPVLKHLVEYDSKNYDRSELLIVMTPRIIRTPEDMQALNQQERERMHWCVRDVVKMTGDASNFRRSEVWYPNEVRHSYGAPVILQETQLPPEPKMPVPMPAPMLPGMIETK
jgi:type II secretory pathway component GspD/PulD (secretin)